MKKPQWTAVAVAAVLLLGIYLFADTKKPLTTATKDATVKAKAESAFDFAGYLTKVKTNLDADTVKLLSVLEENPIANAEKLATIYHAKGESVAEAYYEAQVAEGKHDLPTLVHAGDLFAATSALSQDEGLTAFLKERALNAFKTAVEWDSTITENKLKLATAYMDQGTQPMQGVGILLEIVRKDSANAEAQMLLGKFGLVSQQYEKAIVRLEKVLYLRPRNYDALFLLATAYLNNGEKTKAINALEQCAKLVDKQELKKEIEAYIANIKSKS